MAGDWMKIELELPDKPEIHSIASILHIDPDAVVGKLIRVWQWFDKHTKDGNAFGVTYSLPDRITGVTGFGEAMMFVGWLEQNDKTLTMPKFERHTSSSAKTRSLTKVRVENHRNAPIVTVALPEKRREEKINTKPLSEYSDGFTRFWEIYPNKTGKGKAWESWKKQNPSITEVLKALAWQITSEAWVKDGGQFIPMPATYLNGERWLDESRDVANRPFSMAEFLKEKNGTG